MLLEYSQITYELTQPTYFNLKVKCHFNHTFICYTSLFSTSAALASDMFSTLAISIVVSTLSDLAALSAFSKLVNVSRLLLLILGYNEYLAPSTIGWPFFSASRRASRARIDSYIIPGSNFG